MAIKRNVPVVLTAIAAAAAVGCSTAPPKSAQQEQADNATAERVSAALEANPIYYFRDVDVDVDDGVAVLSGFVWSTDALYHAQIIARAVPGVTAVRNQMQLEREANRGGGDTAGGQ